MDAERFDAVARALTDGASRRTALGLSIGGLLGGAGLFGLAAKRKKRKKKKKCKGDTKKCGKQCIPSASCCSAAECGDGATCEGGACNCPHQCCVAADCPPGSNKECRDNQCRCPAGQGQSGGVCTSASPPDFETCFEPPVNCMTNEQCCNDRCVEGKCTFSELGEPCHQSWYCVEGLTCKAWVCAPKSDEGGTCQVEGDCEFGLHCVDGACVVP
jgi:hypothetical protein